jgi:outer membrane immunogenic protein
MRWLLTGVAAGASLLFLTSAASADGYDAGARPYERPFSWTGFYLGLNAGYAWDTEQDRHLDIHNNFGANFTTRGFNARGGFYGAQAGYNWQHGAVVVGIEADVQAPVPSMIQDGFVRTVTGNVVDAEKEQNFFGTVRGRAGLALGHVLLYGTGGLAYGSIHDHILVNGVADLHQDGVRTGFVAGGGIEYALSPNLSLKVEYLRLDLGGDSLSAPVVPPNGVTVFSNRIEHSFDTVRAGFNYRFDDVRGPLK